jgi:hypothetical protein
MQQAINLIPSTQSNEQVVFEAQSKVNRSEPIVLDDKFLRLISGGTDQPNKTW